MVKTAEHEMANGTAPKSLIAAPATKVEAGGYIALPKLDIRRIMIHLVGDTELIVHSWAVKARRIMLDSQMKKATKGKQAKDPVEDFLGTLYVIDQEGVEVVGDINDPYGDDGHPNVKIQGGRFGFPAIGFKSAAVTACTSLGKSITKVQARQAFHVDGELVEIKGQPRMREDMVRLGGTTADIRHRAGFPQWEADVTIAFNSRVLSEEQIVNLFNTAGFSVGVGDWRVESDGTSGRFHVA